MLIQFQIIKGDEDNYKLAVRVDTTNEAGISHTEIVDLKDSLTESFVRLMYPCAIDFKSVEANATEEAVNKVKEQQAQAESMKSTEEVAAVQSDSSI